MDYKGRQLLLFSQLLVSVFFHLGGGIAVRDADRDRVAGGPFWGAVVSSSTDGDWISLGGSGETVLSVMEDCRVGLRGVVLLLLVIDDRVDDGETRRRLLD